MGKPRTTRSKGVTLDAGALIALDRGNRRMIALLEAVAKAGGRFHVPAGVLGQAWRDGSRQANLARFLRTPVVEIEVLDAPTARACGELCAARNTRDVIDASIVVLARKHQESLITSDPGDLARLDPDLDIRQI